MISPGLTVIIPAYNEEQSLGKVLPMVLDFCKQRGFKLLIINDGSKDKTKEIIQSFLHEPVLNTVNHKLNKGYGGAIKSGIMAADTEYIITIDADGQHVLEDIDLLYAKMKEQDADMVIGSRESHRSASWYRGLGKWIIRFVAKMLMPINIYDINSGMKLCRTELAKKYISLYPNSMAYSDVITLVFISQRHLVIEQNISIRKRLGGTSTISTRTAFETILEIINIVILFNPMKIFLSISLACIISGLAWGLPIVIQGRGVSPGALLGVVTGVLFFFLGLITEQLTLIRKRNL